MRDPMGHLNPLEREWVYIVRKLLKSATTEPLSLQAVVEEIVLKGDRWPRDHRKTHALRSAIQHMTDTGELPLESQAARTAAEEDRRVLRVNMAARKDTRKATTPQRPSSAIPLDEESQG